MGWSVRQHDGGGVAQQRMLDVLLGHQGLLQRDWPLAFDGDRTSVDHFVKPEPWIRQLRWQWIESARTLCWYRMASGLACHRTCLRPRDHPAGHEPKRHLRADPLRAPALGQTRPSGSSPPGRSGTTSRCSNKKRRLTNHGGGLPDAQTCGRRSDAFYDGLPVEPASYTVAEAVEDWLKSGFAVAIPQRPRRARSGHAPT